MPRIAAGVVRFKKEVFPKKKALFARLASGQSPEALFITCSDSRIDPSLVTQTEPGELFICRNAGSIVPPCTKFSGGMTASIEYAAAVLRVPHIIVCGHIGCGAMDGAMHPESLTGFPHVREWLGHAFDAVLYIRKHAAGMDEEARMRMLVEQNVLLQIEHLRTHPSVARCLTDGTVRLHGWVYDIGTGDVRAWDEDAGRFLPVEERYAEELAAAGKLPVK